MPGSRGPGPHAAFTIIELLISLSIASFVLMCVASLIGLSTKAIPAEGGVQETALDAGNFLGRLAADAAIAYEVIEHTPEAVTFITPDQDGDASPDKVRYAWTGVAGDPIEREINGTDQTKMLGGVSSLVFDYEFANVPVYSELSVTTDGKSTLQSSLLSIVTSRSLAGTHVAQVFAPSLPADAIAWTLDELTISLGPSGLLTPPTTVHVQIRGCDGSNKPSGAIYAQTSISESSLGLLGLLPANATFTFSNVMVPASSKLCVVVRCSGGDGTALVGTAAALGWPVGAPALSSSDGGGTWSTAAGFVVGHGVAGRVVRSSGGKSSRKVVSRFTVSLEAGQESLAVEFAVGDRNPAEATP
jgi:hypothetical protein